MILNFDCVNMCRDVKVTENDRKYMTQTTHKYAPGSGSYRHIKYILEYQIQKILNKNLNG